MNREEYTTIYTEALYNIVKDALATTKEGTELHKALDTLKTDCEFQAPEMYPQLWERASQIVSDYPSLHGIWHHHRKTVDVAFKEYSKTKKG